MGGEGISGEGARRQVGLRGSMGEGEGWGGSVRAYPKVRHGVGLEGRRASQRVSRGEEQGLGWGVSGWGGEAGQVRGPG